MRGLVGAVVVAVLTLVACGGSDDAGGDDGMARKGAAGTASEGQQTAYVLPPCPDLPQAEPRADGLPPLRLPCLGGGPEVRLSDLRGTPTVVNVWAAWCTNCDREMPLFADAMTRAGDRLRFFGVHYKAPESYGITSAEDFGVPFPSVHDADGDLVALQLRAKAPPQTLFVAGDGRLAGRKVGEIRSQDEFDELVERYLGVTL